MADRNLNLETWQDVLLFLPVNRGMRTYILCQCKLYSSLSIIFFCRIYTYYQLFVVQSTHQSESKPAIKQKNNGEKKISNLLRQYKKCYLT